MLRLYTDGSSAAATNHERLGGWGYCICEPGGEAAPIEGASGRCPGPVTTSQRSELRAAAYGLNHVLEWTESGVWTGREVELWTDSQYVLTMLRGGKARANPDLVAQLLAAKAMLEAAGVAVRMRHVAAHRGHVGNEMADQLSTLWRG